MKRALKIGLWVSVTLAVVVGFCVWKNWHDRYVWPAPVAWMQDLPSEDRSHWPKEPVALKQETVRVEAATPQGLKTISTTHYINRPMQFTLAMLEIEPFSPLSQVVRPHEQE